MIDSLLSDENKMFREAVRKFAEEKIAPNVKTWEKERKYPLIYGWKHYFRLKKDKIIK